FFAIGFFIVMAAGMLKTQSTWKYYHEQYVARLAEQNATLQRVVEGDPADAASVAGSVVSLQKALDLEMIGRGLVWRSMVPTAVAEDDGHIHVTIDATYWGDNACVRPDAPIEAPAEEAPVEEAPAEEPPAEGEEGEEEAPAE